MEDLHTHDSVVVASQTITVPRLNSMENWNSLGAHKVISKTSEKRGG